MPPLRPPLRLPSPLPHRENIAPVLASVADVLVVEGKSLVEEEVDTSHVLTYRYSHMYMSQLYSFYPMPSLLPLKRQHPPCQLVMPDIAVWQWMIALSHQQSRRILFSLSPTCTHRLPCLTAIITTPESVVFVSVAQGRYEPLFAHLQRMLVGVLPLEALTIQQTR